jgi:hypothetical protein
LGKALRASERIGDDLADCFDGWRGYGLPKGTADRRDFGLALLGMFMPSGYAGAGWKASGLLMAGTQK